MDSEQISELALCFPNFESGPSQFSFGELLTDFVARNARVESIFNSYINIYRLGLRFLWHLAMRRLSLFSFSGNFDGIRTYIIAPPPTLSLESILSLADDAITFHPFLHLVRCDSSNRGEGLRTSLVGVDPALRRVRLLYYSSNQSGAMLMRLCLSTVVA